MKRKTKNEVDIVVPNVEGVTLRSVPGGGDQVEVIIKQRRGEFSLRLLTREDRGLRVVDLRRRDKKKTPRLSIPWRNGTED